MHSNPVVGHVIINIKRMIGRAVATLRDFQRWIADGFVQEILGFQGIRSVIKSSRKMLGIHNRYKTLETYPLAGYDAHMAQMRQIYTPLANGFSYYQYVVQALAELPEATLTPLSEFAGQSNAGGKIIGLRHDVDGDPETAVRCARFLSRNGWAGSFYLLSTSGYYGEISNGVFIRNPLVKEWVKALAVAGSEIGLHNDALNLCHQGYDGIKALIAEITWLRSMGIRIQGTVAHNSGPIYEAENFEIFADRVLWPRSVSTAYGNVLPLGAVRMSDLGLTYEGTFSVPRADIDTRKAHAFFGDKEASKLRSEEWMRAFLHDNPSCLHELDVQLWLIGRDEWVIAGARGRVDEFAWLVSFEEVRKFLRGLRGNRRILAALHPEYFMDIDR